MADFFLKQSKSIQESSINLTSNSNTTILQSPQLQASSKSLELVPTYLENTSKEIYWDLRRIMGKEPFAIKMHQLTQLKEQKTHNENSSFVKSIEILRIDKHQSLNPMKEKQFLDSLIEISQISSTFVFQITTYKNSLDGGARRSKGTERIQKPQIVSVTPDDYQTITTNFCARNRMCNSEQESLCNYVASLVEGEQINNKAKYFIAIIQLFFTTDQLLLRYQQSGQKNAKEYVLMVDSIQSRVERKIFDEFTYRQKPRVIERKQLCLTISKKLILNLDLACEKAKQEGLKVLSKYDQVEFYLTNIAFGQVYDFQAKNAVKAQSHQNNSTVSPNINYSRSILRNNNLSTSVIKPSKSQQRDSFLERNSLIEPTDWRKIQQKAQVRVKSSEGQKLKVDLLKQVANSKQQRLLKSLTMHKRQTSTESLPQTDKAKLLFQRAKESKHPIKINFDLKSLLVSHCTVVDAESDKQRKTTSLSIVTESIRESELR